MRSTLRGLWLALVLACALFGVAHAATPADDALTAARKQMDSLQKRMAASPTLEALAGLRAEANELQSQTDALAAELAPQVANVEARLAELGAAPAGKSDEAADLTARRNGLTAQRAELDAQLRLAKLLTIEAQQAAAQIDTLRRERFEAQLGERTPSILARPFWTELRQSWIRDLPLVQALVTDVAEAAGSTSAWAWVAVLAAIVGLFAALPRLRKLLTGFITRRVPQGRIRRSLLALGTILLNAGAILVATHAVYWIVVADKEVRPAVDALLLGFATSVSFGGYVAALGRALMSPSRPSWRLPPLPDALATRLKHDPLWLGLVVAIGWSFNRIVTAVNAGLATAVAVNCLFSLALGIVLVRTMQRGESARRELVADPESKGVPPRPLWLLAVVIANWLVVLASLVCLLIGYVGLGSLLIRQVAWILIVASTAWLLATLVEDACDAWLGDGSEGDDDRPKAVASATLRSQVAVLLSAAVRLVIVLVALATMVGPLGQGPMELMERADSLREGIAIGEMRILPGSVLQALVVLALGILAVRAAKGWLLDRYLPTTSLDAGMRSSTATLLGYVGFVFAVALSLSALGLGLERVAWVASALSVGIGFGLQAVVQNFVSGLILLTERPVKVGDWVSLGGVEGDVRRINVRATEIQMGDRSTVIVPNSEFITKVVRNVTHANPLGLVQLKLPMPLSTDPEPVRALILEAMTANEDVLDSPSPNVQLDGIDGTNLIFSATASVASPRQAASVRSALLFDILARLKRDRVAVAASPAAEPPAPAPE